MKEELKEWCGIKPADFLVYAACGAIVWMYFSESILLDSILSVAAVALCVASCPLGMKAAPGLSQLTNWIKKTAYPICLIIALICIFLNFTKWNRSPEEREQMPNKASILTPDPLRVQSAMAIQPLTQKSERAPGQA